MSMCLQDTCVLFGSLYVHSHSFFCGIHALLLEKSNFLYISDKRANKQTDRQIDRGETYLFLKKKNAAFIL